MSQYEQTPALMGGRGSGNRQADRLDIPENSQTQAPFQQVAALAAWSAPRIAVRHTSQRIRPVQIAGAAGLGGRAA